MSKQGNLRVIITGASSVIGAAGFEAGEGGAIDGGFRDPDRGRKVAVAGGLGLAALAAGGLAWWTARRPKHA